MDKYSYFSFCLTPYLLGMPRPERHAILIHDRAPLCSSMVEEQREFALLNLRKILMATSAFSNEDILLMAGAEIVPDQDPGNPNWRTAPISNMPQYTATAAATKEVVAYAAPHRTVEAAPHFLGGSWDDSKIAKERFKRLADSPWKVVDLETTGRTPYSVPVRTKDPAAGKLRGRIISATWTNVDGSIESAAWDLDTMDPAERAQLAKSCLTETFIAHNAAFDLGWLHHLIRDAGLTVTDKMWPKQVLCTLHLSRQLFPENRRELRIAATNPADHRQDWIKARLLKDRGMENWGNSLEDITYSLNLPWTSDLDKSYQKPANWVLPAPLSPGHFRYVQDDAILPLVIVHRLATGDKSLPLDSQKSKGELILEAANWLNQNVDKLKEIPGVQTYFSVHHGAMRHVVNVAAKGMPYDMRLSEKYKAGMMQKIRLAVDGDPEQPEKYPGIHDINFPHLAPFKEILKDPQVGLSQELVEAWIRTFKQYDPDVPIPKTNTGEYSLSAKDLRKNRLDKRPSKPVYDLLNIIQKSKQAVKMIDNLDNFVRRAIDRGDLTEAQGRLDRGLARLHPLLGFGPGTDRLSSNDPNAQNFPRDPNFRALVRARPGHKIISADYGQIELRIAAGLALRGQAEFNKLLTNDAHKEPTALGDRAVRQLKRLWSTLEQRGLESCETIEGKMMAEEQYWDKALKGKLASFNDGNKSHDGMQDKSYQEIKDERDLRRLMIYAVRIYRKRKEFNTDQYSALAIAFREGIDPHLFTGLAMAQNSGKDIGGPDPLTVIRTAKAADATFAKDFKASGKPDTDENGKKISMTPNADALKSKFKVERNNAKAVNFGLLYGMTAETLHMTGVVTYGSDWSKEEAQAASDAWFGLYPELGFWQYFTILRPEWEGEGMVCKVNRRAGSAKVDPKQLRSWRVESLYGRTYVREAFREALNYQDQGTGAHMVFRAFELMPKLVRESLIDQIHDEILCEARDEDVDKVLKGLVSAMEKAGKEALGPFHIPVEAEAEVGEVWLHGDAPTIPLDPDVEWTNSQIGEMAIPEEQEETLDPTMGAM